jgi:hypothetical protein
LCLIRRGGTHEKNTLYYRNTAGSPRRPRL